MVKLSGKAAVADADVLVQSAKVCPRKVDRMSGLLRMVLSLRKLRSHLLKCMFYSGVLLE